ncbi:MAG TPA: hypothetical protein DEQ02_05580 [Ruminococcaceae bacterium]|nr:hypothetical protein [Oscillospiraceae bacterium]
MRYRKGGNEFLRHALYAVILILCYMLQSAGILPRIYGISALPVIPAVTGIAMLESDTAGIFYGLAAGILMDFGSVGFPGFNAVLLMTAGCTVGLMITLLLRRSKISAVLMTSGVLFVYVTLHWLFFYLFAGHSQAFYHYVRYSLPCAFYSLITFFVIYPILSLIRRVLRPMR